MLPSCNIAEDIESAHAYQYVLSPGHIALSHAFPGGASSMGRLKQVGVRALSSLLAAPPPPQAAHQSFQPVHVEELNRAPPRHFDEPLFHQLAKRPRHGFYRQPEVIRYSIVNPR